MTATLLAPWIESVEVRTCYLCGSEGERLYTGLRDGWAGAPGVWGLYRCRRCKLVWLDPRPERHELHKLYGEGYYTHSIPREGRPDSTGMLRRIVKQALQPQTPAPLPVRVRARSGLERRAARALRAMGPVREVAAGLVMWLEASRPGRLLDVGCGNGAFLARMRELGWQVEGLEPDPVAARAATSQYGLDVTCAPLEDAALAAESFDVVTMSHVIEHVHDPVEALVECGRLLRPGGRLVVVTPNTRSLGRSWFRSRWLGWDVPRHLFVFSSRSLRTCAERAGLEVEVLRTTARSAFHMLPSIRLLAEVEEPARSRSRARLQAVLFYLLEYLLTRVAARGEEILLTARRPR